MTGPKSGQQTEVRYCPTCKTEIISTASNKQPEKTSHRYECVNESCKNVFEINQLGGN